MTLRALSTCLFACLSILILGSCRDAAQIEALNTQIRSLEATQKQAKTDLSRVQLQLRTLQQETESIESEKEKLEFQLKEAKESLDTLLKEYEDYKSQYKVSIQRNARGMELEDIVFDGRDYRKVRVRDLTDSMLTIMHQNGTASFRLSELPPALQRLMGYEVGFPIKLKHGRSTAVGMVAELDGREKLAVLQAEVSSLNQRSEVLRRKLSEGQVASNAEKNDPEKKLIIDRSNAALEVQFTKLTVELNRLKAEELKLSRSLGYNAR